MSNIDFINYNRTSVYGYTSAQVNLRLRLLSNPTRGGFRHVQHVRPNRASTKAYFFILLQHGNKPEILK